MSSCNSLWKTICAIIQRLFGENKLITRFDGRSCIDDWLCAQIRPSIDIYSRNYEVGSMGVGAGLYMYDAVVKCSRSLSHLMMSSCYTMWTGLLRYTRPSAFPSSIHCGMWVTTHKKEGVSPILAVFAPKIVCYGNVPWPIGKTTRLNSYTNMSTNLKIWWRSVL